MYNYYCFYLYEFIMIDVIVYKESDFKNTIATLFGNDYLVDTTTSVECMQ